MMNKHAFDTTLVESESTPRRILVWDAPVRVFHWLMVLSFAGAYLTAEQDGLRLLHITFGYTMAGLVAFRIVWGVIGTRYARFANFVRGPRSVLHYFHALVRGQPEHYVGHNPAGAMTILSFLLLTVIIALSGWATYSQLAGEIMEEVHEFFANVMLGIAGIHVTGVIISSRLHRENLIGSMISGCKTGKPCDGIRRTWLSIGAALLIAVLVFWWFQWHNASETRPPYDSPSVSTHSNSREHDD